MSNNQTLITSWPTFLVVVAIILVTLLPFMTFQAQRVLHARQANQGSYTVGGGLFGTKQEILAIIEQREKEADEEKQSGIAYMRVALTVGICILAMACAVIIAGLFKGLPATYSQMTSIILGALSSFPASYFAWGARSYTRSRSDQKRLGAAKFAVIRYDMEVDMENKMQILREIEQYICK